MEKRALQPLNAMEKELAENNHNLVYSFLHRNKYDIEEFYSIAVFGYLKAIQAYCRIEEKRKKYDLPLLAWLYMRAEMSNHFRMEKSRCRQLGKEVLSFEADDLMEKIYNLDSGKSAEDDVMEKELLTYVLESLTDIQRKIIQSKIDGFSNKEVYMTLEIKPSTYYKEMENLKAVVVELLA